MNFIKPVYMYLGLIALLAYMPLLGHLNNLPIRQFDEARLAMNAYEMSKSGNIIVTTFSGQPDMWNTKPPLMIWLQCLCMKFMGVNELAVRLPAALAAMSTCLVIFLFAFKYLKSMMTGAMAILVLITTDGFIDVHASRTGDYDALLTLFTTLSGISFFIYIRFQRVKSLYACAIWLTFATLTKGIVALLFLPAFLIYAIWAGALKSIFAQRHFYFAFLGWVCITFGYYLTREWYNPGYLKAVYSNELGGRYLEVIEHHQHGFGYYLHDIITAGFFPWWMLIPLGIYTGLKSREAILKQTVMFCLCMSMVFLLIISTASTKLEWYEVPVYPWLALLVAMAIDYLYKTIHTFIQKPDWKKPITAGFLILLFAFPYTRIWSKTHTPEEQAWTRGAYDICYFLRDALHGRYDIQGFKIVHPGYHPEVEFYTLMLKDKGIVIEYADYRALKMGETVIMAKPEIKDSIMAHFTTQPMYHINSVEVHHIQSDYIP